MKQIWEKKHLSNNTEIENNRRPHILLYHIIMTLLQAEEFEGDMQWSYESALLEKLQQMVPIMPRERELTKLEIINYVIDYIKHLKELAVDDVM